MELPPDTPPRLLALDVGSRRIGLAMTTPLDLPGSSAAQHVQPLFTLHRKGDRADLKSIARVVRKHAITELIVGHPLALSGDRTPQTLRTERFADELRYTLGRPVHLHDERLSTVAAHEHLAHSAPRKPTKAGLAAEKAVIDQVAAVLILEGYLAHRAHLDAIARTRADDAPAPPANIPDLP